MKRAAPGKAKEELDDISDSVVSPSDFKRMKNEVVGGANSGTSDMETSSEELYFKDPEKLQKMAAAFKTIMECCGEDVDREGLRATPMRVMAPKSMQKG